MNPTTPGGKMVFLNAGYRDLNFERLSNFISTNADIIGEFLFGQDISCVFRFAHIHLHPKEEPEYPEIVQSRLVCEWMQKQKPFRFPRRSIEESDSADGRASNIHLKDTKRLPRVCSFYLPPPKEKSSEADTLEPIYGVFYGAERQRVTSIRREHWMTLFVLPKKVYRDVCYRISELPLHAKSDADTVCLNEAIHPGLCIVANFRNLDCNGIPTGLLGATRINHKKLRIPIERRTVETFRKTHVYPVS